MKSKKLQLQEKRGDLVDELKKINESPADGDSLSEEQVNRVGEIRSKMANLDTQIEIEKTLLEEQGAQNQRNIDNDPDIQANIVKNRDKGEKAGKAVLRKGFSYRLAILNHIEGRKNDGQTLEVIQEGKKEANERNLNVGSGVYVPTMMIGNPTHRRQNIERRTTLTVGTAATAGNLVFDDDPEMIGYLYPRTVLNEMGVRYITDLVGPLPLVRKDGAGTFGWLSETGTMTETNPTYSIERMTPKRIGGVEPYSLQLLRQSSFSVEMEVRNDISNGMGQGIESGAINGTGASNQPTGLLNISGMPTVAIGTNGGALTWAKTVEFESTNATNNADLGTMFYLTTPGVVGHAKTTLKAAGVSGYIMESNNEMNSYRTVRSTLMPSNLTKGSGTDLHAAIFGQFANLYIAQWGGIELIVDPYTRKKESIYEISVAGFYDINVKHKESFVICKDIDPS